VFSRRRSLSVSTSSRTRRLSRRRRSSIRNKLRRRRGALHARRSTRSARSSSVIATITAPRGGRRGSWASPLTRTRRQSHRGVAMSPARRSTGATCRGHPRHHRLAALKSRRRAGRRQWGATRLWARAHVRQLTIGKRLTCELNLAEEHHSAEGFPQSIR
jgi:hypothetical protein